MFGMLSSLWLGFRPFSYMAPSLVGGPGPVEHGVVSIWKAK